MNQAAPHSTLTSIARLAAVGASLLLLTVITAHRSQAAFSASTDNTSNNITAGSISLTDDDSGTALFNVTDLFPGDPVVNCLAVTYHGPVPTSIRLFDTSGSTPNDVNFTIKIEDGTDGGFNDCARFHPSGSVIFDGSFDVLHASHRNFTTGIQLPNFAVRGTRVYRITIGVVDDDSVQGQSVTASFSFEART